MKKFKIDESSLAPAEPPRIALKLGDLEYRFSKNENSPDIFYATYTEHGHAYTIVVKEITTNHWSAEITHFGAHDKDTAFKANNIGGLLNDVKSKIIEEINKHRETW